MGRLKGLPRWSGWAVLLLAVAFAFILWDVHVYFDLRYGTPLLDMVFWQQLVTTFIGAVLALATAWALYRHQQKASEAASLVAANREALNLLLSLRRDLDRDRALMEALANREDLAAFRFNRLRTVFLEIACRRLLDLRGNSELARMMTDVLDLHSGLNRSLEAHFQVYYGFANPAMRGPLLEQLQQIIPAFAREHLGTASGLIDKIDAEVKSLMTVA